MLNFTKTKVFLIYLILAISIFFSSLNLKTNNLIDKKVNLGLDLQGGSYILLEIDTTPLVNQKLQSKVIPIKKLLKENKISFQDFSVSNENISFLINLKEQSKLKTEFFFVIRQFRLTDSCVSFSSLISKTKINFMTAE